MRVKGLQPEEKGFDYYTSTRTPRKQTEREEGGREGEGDSEPLLESGYDDEEEEERERRRERGSIATVQASSEDSQTAGERRSSSSSSRKRSRTASLRGNPAGSKPRIVSSESDDGENLQETGKSDLRTKEDGERTAERLREGVCRTPFSSAESVDTSTAPQTSSTVVSIQRSLRRKERVKQRIVAARNRPSSALGGGGGGGGRDERCNDDIITVATEESRASGYNARSSRNGVDFESSSASPPPTTTNRRRSSWSGGAPPWKGKSLVDSDDVAPLKGGSGSGEGGRVWCNGVKGLASDLWLGGGGCASDVLVDMETESPSGRNSNSKSTHACAVTTATTNSGQVLSAKSTPTTAVSSGNISNLNSNSKSTQSVPSAVHIDSSSAGHLGPSEVEIDSARLVSLFQRVVMETDGVSVELMEKMLSTFNHLVFRYRMRTDRRQLPKVRKGLKDVGLNFPFPGPGTGC